MLKNWIFLYFLEGEYKIRGKSIMEENLAVSCKTEHAITIRSSNCICGHLFKRNENLYSCKNLSMTIDSSFI